MQKDLDLAVGDILEVKDTKARFVVTEVNDNVLYFCEEGSGSNPSYYYLTAFMKDAIRTAYNIIKKGRCAPGTKCECGTDTHGFARHAEWCPKYEPLILS